MKDIRSTPTSLGIELRELKLADLDEVTRVHLAAFPGSALTRLGTGAVQRYYDWQMTGPHQCVSLGVWQGPLLCGFSFAGKFNGALGGFLRKHRWFLSTRVLCQPWLALHPWFRERMRIAVRSLMRRSPKACLEGAEIRKPEAHSSFGVLSIAVDPRAKRKGIGTLLMLACEQTARRWGADTMNLTVAVDNTEAIRFYEKLGWRRDGSSARWNGQMLKELPTGPSNDRTAATGRLNRLT